MLDLDLLVHEKDASAAWSRLEGQGWEQWERGPADPFYHGHHHLRPLLDTRGTETCLELHTAMLPPHSPFRLDVDRVWETGHRVRLGTDEAWTPSPEYLVVHLCIHLAWSHAFESRGWATFRDLAAVLDSTQVDWRRVKDLAGEARAESCCYWTLRLAGALVQLPLPAGVLETLAFPGPEAVKRVAERHLATTLFSADAQPCPSVALTRSLWSLALRPRRSGHGEARPWSSAEAYRNAMPGGHRDHGLVSRLGHQLSEYRAWIRYLLKILR
jgi:hypothetical protein